MKKFSIIAMVLAFTMMLSVVSFAADPAFMLAEDAVVPEGTTVTPAADSIAVETTAVAGNYYGVLLVEGNALPTVDNAILYINQATAAEVKQAFSVLPIIPEAGTELTLYISSNVAGAELIAIPMVYDAEEEVIVPTVSIADINGDEDITNGDAMEIINFVNWEASLLDAMDWDTQAIPVADINGDEDITNGDAMEIINYVNWEPSLLDEILF